MRSNSVRRIFQLRNFVLLVIFHSDKNFSYRKTILLCNRCNRSLSIAIENIARVRKKEKRIKQATMVYSATSSLWKLSNGKKILIKQDAMQPYYHTRTINLRLKHFNLRRYIPRVFRTAIYKYTQQQCVVVPCIKTGVSSSRQ